MHILSPIVGVLIAGGTIGIAGPQEEDAVSKPVGAQCLIISPSTLLRSHLHRALKRTHIAG
jgi:hypothetical protein